VKVSGTEDVAVEALEETTDGSVVGDGVGSGEDSTVL
jgi:hypothetical protein